MPFVELTPVLVQSIFVALMVVVIPLAEIPKQRRLKQFTSAAKRLATFHTGIAILWTYALVAFVLATPNNLFVVPQANIEMAWLFDNRLAQLITIVLMLIYFGLAFAPSLHCAMMPNARAKYESALRSLYYMLPVSERERHWWVLLSISAGVCEELVFRGFLQQFLQGNLHGGWHLDLTSAWLLAAIGFGCCHLYQGLAGFVRTTLAGLLFGLLAILSGNLLLAIVLHILVDLAVLFVYHPRLDNPDEAARLIEGCDPRLTQVDTAQ